MIKASIISIGNELLSGQAVDTNTAYLCGELLSMGVEVHSSCTVGDDVHLIASAIERATATADIVLITGGLGPTDDDITRQGLADFLSVELELRPELLEEITSFFAKRRFPMADKNKVQAYIPAGCTALKNEVGTAPGIMAKRDGKIIAVMPGVPREMKRMFADSVAGEIENLATGQVVIIRKLKCIGIGESVIAEKLGDLMARDRDPLINCTVSGGVITLHIVARAKTKAAAEAMIEKDADRLRQILGKLVYGHDDETLAQAVGNQLRQAGKTIAVAESCTGGLISKMLTDTAGASEHFVSGWVTYSNEAKISELGVDRELIQSHGAVSKEVAAAMAEGARKKAHTDFAIAVTGIAGPGGGTVEKPVGLVYIALAMNDECVVREHIFSHDRIQVRQRTALTALNLLRLAI